ncbi:MAG: hypothetical protein QRY74_00345 [Chlamydia sp.]
MPSFKIINSLNEIEFSAHWAPSLKFASKDRIVTAYGKPLTSDYQGRTYQLIEKHEQLFSTSKRMSRICLGILAIIASLGMALLSEKIRHLFTKSKETIRFGIPFIAPIISTESTPLSSHNNSTDPVSIPIQTQEPSIFYPDRRVEIDKDAR